jgi:hypothetical protein
MAEERREPLRYREVRWGADCLTELGKLLGDGALVTEVMAALKQALSRDPEHGEAPDPAYPNSRIDGTRRLRPNMPALIVFYTFDDSEVNIWRVEAVEDTPPS